MNGARFREIVGHGRQVAWLRRAVTRSLVPHAVLITGVAGVGKKTVARALASALLCVHPAEGEACGRCVSCRAESHGTHPDLVCIDPEERSIRIERIREIRHAMRHKPVLGTYRVILLFDAERLTPEAANALLKTLEEPPPGNTLILTAPDDRILLPTIVSRCRRLALSPLPNSTVETHLIQRRGVEPDRARVLAGLSEGSLGRALAWLDEEKKTGTSPLQRKEDLLGRLRQLKKNDIKIALSLAKTWSDTDESTEEFINTVRFWIRDRLRTSAGLAARVPLEDPAGTEIRDTGWMVRILDHVEASAGALRRNANRRLVLENLLLRLRRMGET